MRKISTLLAAMTLSSLVYAQDFYTEGGLMGGGSYVAGDVSNQQNIGTTVSALFRYNINFKSALKLTGGYISTPVNAQYSKGWEAALQYELHFLQYGTQTYGYRGVKRFTPYYALGLGYTKLEHTTAVTIPIAVGVKWKVARRINVGAEVCAKWLSNDLYDGVRFPNIERQDIIHKDWTIGLSVFATFDFFRKHEEGMNLRNVKKHRRRLNNMPFER